VFLPPSQQEIGRSSLILIVPSMTSRPVEWSELRKLSRVPGGASKTFGKAIGSGVLKVTRTLPAGAPLPLTSSGVPTKGAAVREKESQR
jgi:hypothetical protein